MGFVSILRKLSTSLVRSLLGLFLVLMLFLHFWNLTPAGYIGTLMDDVFDHASPASKQGFTEKLLSVCDTVGGESSMAGALLGKAQEAKGGGLSSEELDIMIDICTKEETRDEVRGECDWLKSYPTAKTFPAGMDSMFDSVDDLQTACDAIESPDFKESCKPLEAFGSGGTMGGILATLEAGCSRYKQGTDSGDDAAKAVIVGIAASFTGQDMGSVKGLLPENVQDPRAQRALRIIDAALIGFAMIKRSLALHLGAILAVIGIIVLINIKHLDYAIKKISSSMIGPGISIVLPYAALQLYLAFAKVDTSPFFLALGGMTGFGQNIGGLITSILPFLIVRTYTTSLIIATAALALLGILIRVGGLSVLKVAKKDKKEEEEKKGKEKQEKKKGEKSEKKSLLSRLLPRRKKAEEKKEPEGKEAKEKETPKEEPEIPKPKEEEKQKEKGEPEDKAPKEKKKKPKKAK